MRQRVFAQCDFDFHARIAIVAKHLNHTRHRLTVPLRLFNQLNGDHLPRLGVTRLARRHHELLTDAFVFGHHKIHAMPVLQATDVLRFGARQNLGDFPFRASASIHAGNTRHYSVAMQHFTHFVGA